MKTIRHFLTESKKASDPKKPAASDNDFKEYQGTPVCVEHGMYSDVEEPKKKDDFKPGIAKNGTYVGFAGIKKGSLKEEVNPKFLGPTRNTPKFAHYGEWINHNDNTHLAEHVDALDKKLLHKYPHGAIPNRKHHLSYSGYSDGLNRHLIFSYMGKKKPDEKVDNIHLPSLDKALDHHSLEDHLHVYSGVGFHPGNEAKKHPSGKLFMPAYTSTSTSKKIAERFARRMDHQGTRLSHEEIQSPNVKEHHKHILHIHLKPGQKGAYLGSQTPRDENEHEYTLPRNTTLQLHPTPDRYQRQVGDKTLHYHVWHAHPVDTVEKE